MTLPAGKGSDILSISAKTNRVHGRVKTLPYSKNEVRLEICKHQFVNQPYKAHRLIGGPLIAKEGIPFAPGGDSTEK